VDPVEAPVPDTVRWVLESWKLRVRFGTPDPGQLAVTRTTTRNGDRWLEIEHADPVIHLSHELLTDLLYRKRQNPDLLAAARLTLAPGNAPWDSWDGDVTRAPNFPVGRERDGTLTALLPDFTGARLGIYAANMNAVYVITGYVEQLTWRAAWPA
jgi:hypothetical protein